MRALLDAHAYLWWLADDQSLGREAQSAIADPGTLVYVSAATIWEIAIKSVLGKLRVDGDLVQEIEDNDFLELPITSRHAQQAGNLPRHHDDPFDRMLIAQAKAEDLVCVTRDPAFELYEVATLW